MNGIFVLPSSTRIQFQKIFQVWFCIKIWANIVAGNRCIQLCLSCQVFFVMQISLSMLVFFLRVITWNVLATVVFQLEMFLKRKKKTVSAIVELREDVCLYEGWGNGWVGRFRVFQLPGTVEGGGTLFWAAAFPRINSAFCAAKYSFFQKHAMIELQLDFLARSSCRHEIQNQWQFEFF